MTEVPRNASRVRVSGDIHIRKSGYHRAAVDVLDLSPTGCRVELPERVAVGETIWVTLPGLQPIEARVAWCRDWIAGLSFKTPLYPSVYEMLLKRFPAD